MRIDVYDTPQFRNRLRRDTTVIIVDPVYTTSCIAEALQNGAREVIPVPDAETAGLMARRIGLRHCVLSGSDGHVMLPGFALGDRPTDFTKEAVNGKSILLHDPEGTQAIFRAKEVDTVYIGSFLNAEAVSAAAVAAGQDVALICAGNEGRFSLDDILCCGALIQRILRMGGDRVLCDLSRTALALYNSYHDELFAVLRATQSVDQLCRTQQEETILACLQEDIYNLVPVYADGTVRVSDFRLEEIVDDNGMQELYP